MIRNGSILDSLVSWVVHLVSTNENCFKDLIEDSKSVVQTIDFNFTNWLVMVWKLQIQFNIYI